MSNKKIIKNLGRLRFIAELILFGSEILFKTMIVLSVSYGIAYIEAVEGGNIYFDIFFIIFMVGGLNWILKDLSLVIKKYLKK